MKILREPEVAAMTGTSRTTRWRLERRGLFPRRRLIADRAIGWFLEEIEAWMRDRPSLGALSPTPSGMRSQGREPVKLMSYADAAARVEGLERSGRGWCLAHHDQRPGGHKSLSLKRGRNGDAWMTCFSGCSKADIVNALRGSEVKRAAGSLVCAGDDRDDKERPSSRDAFGMKHDQRPGRWPRNICARVASRSRPGHQVRQPDASYWYCAARDGGIGHERCR
jgi:prophage regulatory protein